MFHSHLSSSGLAGREEPLRGELVRDFQAGRPRSLSRPWIKAAAAAAGGGGWWRGGTKQSRAKITHSRRSSCRGTPGEQNSRLIDGLLRDRLGLYGIISIIIR